MSLRARRVVVGVGGGIAAFKAVELVRELGRHGAEVQVAMTDSATRFVGPLTFSGLTGRPTITNLLAPDHAGEVHVELASWAEAIVVAPATMNLLARAAAGMADDPVLGTVACAEVPVLWAPAMHTRMWKQPATQRAVETLGADGGRLVGPVEGELASGESGPGRMVEPGALAEAVDHAIRTTSDLAGRTILVSAGPTCEDLDPVRFLTNRSSGRMGYAIAARAAARGAEVTLVAGPTQLPDPPHMETLHVRSAREMAEAITSRADAVDAIVMAAAVADYRPEHTVPDKMHKTDDAMRIELVRNPDILAGLGASRSEDGPLLVGFAVESDDPASGARRKLEQKHADLIVGNRVDMGFGGRDNEAVLVDREREEPLGRTSKNDLADHILDRVREKLDR